MAAAGPTGGGQGFEGAWSIDYPGTRHALGRTQAEYAIWQAAGGAPVQTFPLSDEGWAAAWLAWRQLEGPVEPVVPSTWERGRPISLQPMRAGQIIGGAVRMYRLHFSKLLAVVAPAMLGLYGLIVVLNWITLRQVEVQTPFGRVPQLQTPAWVTLVTNILNALVIQFLTAAVAKAAADGFRGGRVLAGRAYRFAFLKIFPVGWVLILSYVIFLLPFLPGAALLWLGTRLETDLFLGGAVILLLGAVPVLIYLFVRLVLAPVTVAVDNLRGGAALRRAWRLSRGVGWRILGSYILAGLIAVGVQLVVVVAAVVPIAVGGGGITRATLTSLVAAGGLALTFVTPFLNLVVILLYADARLRGDGVAADVLWEGAGEPAPWPG
jgi:hypothetical protein